MAKRSKRSHQTRYRYTREVLSLIMDTELAILVLRSMGVRHDTDSINLESLKKRLCVLQERLTKEST